MAKLKSRRITMNLDHHYANPAGPTKRELLDGLVVAAAALADRYGCLKSQGHTVPQTQLGAEIDEVCRAVAALKEKET